MAMFEVLEKYLSDKLHVSSIDVQQLRPLLKLKQVKKGEILLQAGDICKGTYFVQGGCLRSYVNDPKGKQHVIYFAPENWWAGDQNSVVNKVPAIFSIDAIEDCDLVFASAEVMAKLDTLIPGVASMFATLSQRNIFSLQKRLVNLLSATAEERYLEFIETYPSLALRLPQKMIAAYIGVAPESLSRIRSQIGVKR